MDTIPREPKRLIQARIGSAAYTRIKVEAARIHKDPGDVITSLAMQHLPEVPGESDADPESDQKAQ